MNAVKAALDAARRAQESTYSGVVTVTERKKVRDERSKLTEERDVVVLEGQPCRLSFETLKAARQTKSAAGIEQVIKLFLAPEVRISPGSRVTVTQDGMTADYGCSGIPAIYPTPQEVILEPFRRWA